MFESLDYLYVPSRDVAADVAAFTALGARLVFAIESMGTRVAMVALSDEPPRIVLAGHLDGDRPILVYRVPALASSQRDAAASGWTETHALEIPQGPVRVLESAGGHRLAIYELARPGAIESFAGRRDF